MRRLELTSDVVIQNKAGNTLAAMTIDMQQTAYQAFTGIRAIDHWLFHKHIEDRFVNFWF